MPAMRFQFSGLLAAACTCAACGQDVIAIDPNGGLGPKRPKIGDVPGRHVDCGGHYAETCRVCPQGHGHNWCNGDCVWAFDTCRQTGAGSITIEYTEISINFVFSIYHCWWQCLPGQIVFFIGMTIYAVLFKSKVVDEYPDWIEPRDVEYDDFVDRSLGLFAVFKMPNTCLWAFFCTPVLAAKNYSVGRSIGYWPAYVFMLLIYTPLFPIAVVMRAVMSSKMLRNIRLKPSFGEQCITGLFCMPCAVGRESLEIDNSTNIELTCAFNLNRTDIPDFIEEILDKDEKKGWRDRMCAPKWGGYSRTSCTTCGGHKGEFHSHKEEHNHRRCGCGGSESGRTCS